MASTRPGGLEQTTGRRTDTVKTNDGTARNRGVILSRAKHRLALAPCLPIHDTGCPNPRSGERRLGAHQPACTAPSQRTHGRLWVAERANVAVPRLQRGCFTCPRARHVGWLALREQLVRAVRADGGGLVCMLLLFQLVRVVLKSYISVASY